MLKKQSPYTEMTSVQLIREYGYLCSRLGVKALQPLKEIEFEMDKEIIENELLSRLKRGQK